MRIFAMLTLVLSVAVGCRGNEREAIEAKCDASLRQRVEDAVRKGDTTPLDVLGRTAGVIDEARRQQLDKAGAQVVEVKEDLFTARIAPERVAEVASLEFVQSLALSQEREPLNR